MIERYEVKVVRFPTHRPLPDVWKGIQLNFQGKGIIGRSVESLDTYMNWDPNPPPMYVVGVDVANDNFEAIAFPMIRRVFSTLVAQEMISVQPLAAPTGMLLYTDYKYEAKEKIVPWYLVLDDYKYKRAA